MTLKEKFEIATDGWIVADKCEVIADEFAIEFSKWMAKEYWLNSSAKYKQRQTHEELLEIYKKEKQL